MKVAVRNRALYQRALVISAAWALLTLTLCAWSLQAQTYVSGAVEGIWTVESSPYIVEGPIWIEGGTVLSINGGVEVLFIGSDSLAVYGTLLIQQKAYPFVRFASLDPGLGDIWYGIYFIEQDASASILRYVVIEDAQYGINCFNSDPIIEFTTINAEYYGFSAIESSPVFNYNNILINNSSSYPNIVVKGINSINSKLSINECDINIYNESIGSDVSAFGVYSVSDTIILGENRIHVDAKGMSVGVYLCFSYYDSVHHNEIVVTSQNSFVQAGLIHLSSDFKGIIINNTIRVSSPNKDIGFNIWGSSSKTILNNIVVGDHNSVGINSTQSYNLVQYNDFYGHSVASVGCPLDSTNLFADPEFLLVAPDSIYHLRDSSPCIDHGSPDSVFIDPDGTRNDIGAHYHHQSVDVNPPWEQELLPASHCLTCYPNPTNSSTEITFTLYCAGWVTIDCYDLLGRNLGNIIDGHFESGVHGLQWDLSDKASGLYFLRLRTNNVTTMRRLVLMK